VGQEKFGSKCEIKNLNSISGVRRALEFEIQRQIDVVSKGGTIRQETRRWDDASGQTYTMRVKEQAHDYRYFPDPDLLPIRTDDGLLDLARTRVPELPQQKKARLINEFGISDYQADVLTGDRALCAYYEKAASATPHKVAVANFITNDFLATEPDTSALTLPPTHFAELAELVASNAITSAQAKKVLAEMVTSLQAPAQIVEKLGLKQISDTGELEKICAEAIASNPRSVADYKAGKGNAINAFKGFVMKATKGQANPNVVDEILRKQLDETAG
jgi:aspartyl-tRNA(Asn)/glutamyl-tRNA(Gln) amidotransferase subunit B